jgi:hypothetical protein
MLRRAAAKMSEKGIKIRALSAVSHVLAFYQ